jgi:hypothetical protein
VAGFKKAVAGFKQAQVGFSRVPGFGEVALVCGTSRVRFRDFIRATSEGVGSFGENAFFPRQ